MYVGYNVGEQLWQIGTEYIVSGVFVGLGTFPQVVQCSWVSAISSEVGVVQRGGWCIVGAW